MSVLEQLERHLGETSNRIYDERVKRVKKQLKEWGVDVKGAEVEGPYIILDGLKFTMDLDYDFIIISNGKITKTGRTLHEVIAIVRELQPQERAEK